MPLKKTKYGGICPLGKFKVNIPAGAGCYDNDPVEECIDCNFGDTSVKKFDLEQICKCPQTMDWDEYDRLRNSYASTDGNHTRKGFWKFVEENYRKK